MKKIFLSILTLGLLFTSCDMNQNPEGTIAEDDAYTSVARVGQLRNQFYNYLRAYTNGSYISYTELQSDLFLGLRGNGGRGSRFSQAQFTASTEETTNMYANMYSALKNVNNFIAKVPEFIEEYNLTGEDLLEVNRYLGEAKFTRAYLYYWLFDHYCQSYTADKANTPALGLQLVTEYNPNLDVKDYPGRSTMQQTVNQIKADLADAYSLIKAYDDQDAQYCVPNASYINHFAVAALQARMALLTQDYTTAVSKAQECIANNGNFALAEGADFIDMWTTDESSENFFLPFGSLAEASSVASPFDYYNYISGYPDRVDYLPTAEVILNYDEDNDLRAAAYFTIDAMNVDAQNTVGYQFMKFPGNPKYVTSSPNYKNLSKPFRIAEQYLILAEAAAMSNQPSVANQALNDLRSVRIDGWDATTNYSGSVLINQVRLERCRELIGEGFRISDLRRWGLGFERFTAYWTWTGYVNASELWVEADTHITYTPNDYRYTWPIPYHQFQINSNLKGQQNPGY